MEWNARIAQLSFALIAALGPTAIAAQESAGGPIYQLEPAVDVPIFALSLAFSIPALLEFPPAACLPDDCDPSAINAFDRAVVGNYSPSHRQAADILIAGFIALPVVLDFFDADLEPWLVDLAVYSQVLLVTQGLTQLVKAAVRRPVPFVYDDSVLLETRREDPDAARSFWSGHTATAFAVATSYTFTFWQRHPDSAWRWVVLGASTALATTIGVLKVEAGYHFWTDIMAGAAAGISIGFLVPWLHQL